MNAEKLRSAIDTLSSLRKECSRLVESRPDLANGAAEVCMHLSLANITLADYLRHVDLGEGPHEALIRTVIGDTPLSSPLPPNA